MTPAENRGERVGIEQTQQAVAAIAAEFAAARAERMRRRHLDPADFRRLAEAGFLKTGLPASGGGYWQDARTSTRPICTLLRTLAHGDPSVALVASIFVRVSTVALAIASLVIRDFYVPYYHPNEAQQFRATRIAAIVIAFVPLIFALFVPEILKLSFFTRALRLSISIVAVIGFTLPGFATSRGATFGLAGSAVVTTAWYLLDNPYGLDNIYIAIVVPVVVMAIERIIAPRRRTTGEALVDTQAGFSGERE